jgi:hypothetical protein
MKKIQILAPKITLPTFNGLFEALLLDLTDYHKSKDYVAEELSQAESAIKKQLDAYQEAVLKALKEARDFQITTTQAKAGTTPVHIADGFFAGESLHNQLIESLNNGTVSRNKVGTFSIKVRQYVDGKVRTAYIHLNDMAFDIIMSDPTRVSLPGSIVPKPPQSPLVHLNYVYSTL